MTSTDHCIITKYDLSDREKEIKRAFFSKKGKNQTSENTQNKQGFSSVYNSNLPQFKDNEEMINKLIDENLTNKKIVASVGNTPTQSGNPLNLIYSQNKILERNVDLLHETQRSIHDLLVYNLQKDKQKKKNGNEQGDSIKQMHLIQQMISPLYQSIEEMKRSLNQMGSFNSRLDTRPSITSNLNEKVDDMVNVHSNFRDTSKRVIKNVELVEKNKQMIKDNAILKAIEDLKGSIGQINSEMSKMENEFGENLRKMVEDREKQNLKNFMGGVQSAVNSVNRGMGKGNFQSKKNNEELDYLEYKNEILEINQRKEEILSDFQFNKLVIPKVARPTEKINFSYKLDFEDDFQSGDHLYRNNNNSSKSNSYALYNSNKMGMSYSSSTDKEMSMNKKANNVFLENLNNSNQMTNKKFNKHMRSLSNTNSGNNLNTMTNTKSMHVRTKSREMQSNQKFNIQENDENKATDPENAEEEMSIADKMRRFQEKMKSLPKKSNEEEKENMMSININSTKNSINRSTEPTSSKYLKSPTVFNKETRQNPLPPVDEKEDVQYEDYVIRQIKIAEKELESNKETKIRKGITLVEVTPQDRKKQNTLEDLILKLCVERMMKKEGKPIDQKYVDIPNGVKENKLPFDFHDMQLRYITEGLFRDYIRNLLRGRKKPANNIHTVHDTQVKYTVDNEMLNIFRDENDRRDRELAKLLDGLLGRFAEMEKNLNNKDPVILKEREDNNIDIDDMVNKITDKIRSNMHININLTQPQPVVRQNPQLEVNSQQIQIEGINKEEEEIKSQSGYMNPFQDTRRVNYEEVNRDIPMPYFINLQDYDISSSSYVSDTKRTIPPPKKKDVDESLSDGQIPNSKIYTDQDTSSYLTTPGKGTQGQNINRIDLNALEKFNRQVQTQLKNFQSLDINDLLDNTDPHDMVDQTVSNRTDNYHESVDEGESSTISINVHKQMINLENKDDLKTLNLYDSDEHRLFQKQFGGESGVDSRVNSELNSHRENKTEFKFFKPGNTTGKLSQNSNPTLFSFQNVLSNRSDRSASVTMTNRPLHSSGGLNQETNKLMSSQGSSNPKFTKISQEEIENLVARQKNLNDKLKLISRNTGPLQDKYNYNNTIAENVSDMEVTIHQELNMIKNYPEKKKEYKTDESSSMNSSMI